MSLSKSLSKHRIKFASVIFVLLFFFAFFFESIFIYIYPGQSGVLFRSLASTPMQTKTYTEGLYLVAPWNKMYIYDLTKQRLTMDVHALTSNGLKVSMRITSIFHPNGSKLIEMTKHIGSDYVDKIIVPTIYSSSREVIGKYRPEDLYTTARHIIHDQVMAAALRKSTELPFVIEDVVVENIEFPGAINAAIESKLKHQQDALAYEYILQMETDKATRRKIEAESIQAYNTIIKNSLNADTLQWQKIKALADLSKSDNSKVVVLEGNNQTVPVLINPESK